jgi:hypothetical protein
MLQQTKIILGTISGWRVVIGPDSAKPQVHHCATPEEVLAWWEKDEAKREGISFATIVTVSETKFKIAVSGFDAGGSPKIGDSVHAKLCKFCNTEHWLLFAPRPSNGGYVCADCTAKIADQ